MFWPNLKVRGISEIHFCFLILMPTAAAQPGALVEAVRKLFLLLAFLVHGLLLVAVHGPLPLNPLEEKEGMKFCQPRGKPVKG